jgi:uncharacterized protein YprB with RNaseH-like and TPR domain
MNREALEKQLELLRQRVARIDRKYVSGPPTLNFLDGAEVENAAGKHWQITRKWPAHAHHGTADVGALSELPDDLLMTLVSELDVKAPVQRWAFLDTETTGLAGGTGTLAFLIGVGWVTAEGFELRQFFLRDHGEEVSALRALSELLERFDVMVTFNGKAFDQPLLETRYRLARIPEPFPRLKHVDLLFSSRRLWKLALESCRLQELEARILGVERHGDVPGATIPDLYFNFLRNGDADPMRPIISHNATDILSLACLTAVVPAAFREPFRVVHGAEMVGLARWLRSQGRIDEAIGLMREAMGRPLSDDLAYHALWHIAEMEKKQGREDAAVAAWTELSTVRNRWQAEALEKLAIHYEHRQKNYGFALELTRAALKIEPSDALRKRESRLAARIARPKSGRLL